MGVYIGGSINRQANLDELKIKEKAGWQIFDDLQKLLNELGKKHNVFIGRESTDEGELFVIHNKKPDFQHIYGGQILFADLGIDDDDSFQSRSDDFINELRNHKELSIFSELEFSEARKSYYSTT